MSRVVITGGAGFVGSHIAEYFFERGEEVIVVVMTLCKVESKTKLELFNFQKYSFSCINNNSI